MLNFFIVFLQKAEWFFSTKCKNFFNSCDRMPKPSCIFTCLGCFSNIFGETNHHLLIGSAKLSCSSFVFHWFTLNFSSVLIIKTNFKKLNKYTELKTYETSNICKKHSMKKLSSSRSVLEVLYRTQSWSRL